jgi:hypothetical protein
VYLSENMAAQVVGDAQTGGACYVARKQLKRALARRKPGVGQWSTFQRHSHLSRVLESLPCGTLILSLGALITHLPSSPSLLRSLEWLSQRACR